MTTTPTSGAADLPEALRPVKPVALIASIQELNAWEARADGELLTPAEGESIILVLHELKRLLALAAGQATAAQPNQYGVEFGMSGTYMHFKIGNQLFKLAYEPDEQEEFDFMKRMLVNAFTTFTHDVKTAYGDALSDAVRVPLNSLHADAAYLIGRLREGSMPYARVIEIIRERIDAALLAAQAANSVPAPPPPPECETEAEKRAFAFGWFKALEAERMKAESVQDDAARESEYRRGYRHGYEQRDAEVRGAMA